MGDREATLNEANLELIDALLPDYLEVASLDDAVNTSEMMETEPWGFSTPVDPFLNQSFCCLTELIERTGLQLKSVVYRSISLNKIFITITLVELNHHNTA